MLPHPSPDRPPGACLAHRMAFNYPSRPICQHLHLYLAMNLNMKPRLKFGTGGRPLAHQPTTRTAQVSRSRHHPPPATPPLTLPTSPHPPQTAVRPALRCLQCIQTERASATPPWGVQAGTTSQTRGGVQHWCGRLAPQSHLTAPVRHPVCVPPDVVVNKLSEGRM